MQLEEALATINAAFQAVLGRSPTDMETLIFEGAWQGQTYPQIADAAGYSINYLTTDAGPKFWRALSEALGEPVTKKNFKAAVRRRAAIAADPIQKPLPEGQNRSPFAASDSTTVPSIPPPAWDARSPIPTTSWGEAPDVSQFYGRDEEQALLDRWIGQEHCRLVAILGMGGIGKSTLATQVAQRFATAWRERGREAGAQCKIQNILREGESPTPFKNEHSSLHRPSDSDAPFVHIVWRSLRNAPPLAVLLTDLVATLSDQQDPDGGRSRLLYWLREKRCLLVLDNLETILQAGDHAGYYREGYEDYGELLRLLGETTHQSCVVLTSREKPVEIAALEGLDGSTRTLQLSGSVATALALMAAKGLTGTAEQQRQLCDRYSYNPLALKIVATTIQDLFDGDIGAFLAEDAVIFNSIRRLLEEQFQRLSELEQAIMTWLAINRDWTDIGELADDVLPAVPKVRLLESLESLKWRGLIDSQQQRYTQQPVVMEYVTEQLVEQLSQELVTAELRQWHRYALVKTTVRDYVMAAQQRLILQPVVEGWRDRFPTRPAQAEHLHRLLATIRQTDPAGYGAGNLLNLANALEMDLAALDFSQLSIRQADLRYRLFQGVNFAQAHFRQSAFKQTFGSVFALTYTLDGTHLITGDNVGVLRLWESPGFQLVQAIQAHSSYVWDIRPSPDGRTIATCSEDQTVKVWDLPTGEPLAELSVTPTIGRAIVWIDEATLAIGGIDGDIRLWQPYASAPVQQFTAHTDIINSLSWQGGPGRLASSSSDGTVKLWQIPAGTCQQIRSFVPAPVRWAAWSPDGQTLACGLEDGSLALWQPDEDAVQWLKGHTNTVWSVDWSPDGQCLASASNDATIRLWDGRTGRCLRVLQGHQNWVWYARWHPQRALIASGGHDGSLRLWDTASGHCLQSCCGHLGNVRAIAPAPDGETLVLGCDDTLLRLWHPNRSSQFDHAIGHQHLIADLCWSPDGERFVSASHDRTLRLWQRSPLRCLKGFHGHTNWVWSVDWHPTQDLLVSGGVDGTVKLWQPHQSQPIRTLTEPTSWVLSVRWHPVGQWLAAAAGDFSIYLWQPETWQCVHVLTGHGHWVWRLAWSPAGNLLASGSYDNTLKLWDVQPGSVTCTRTIAHPSVVSAIAWHPRGDWVATGSHDHQIRLWQPQTGECLAELSGHRNQILALACSPDGRHLYSSSEDETLKTWAISQLTCVDTVTLDRPYEGMNITDVTGLTASQIEGLKALGATSQSL